MGGTARAPRGEDQLAVIQFDQAPVALGDQGVRAAQPDDSRPEQRIELHPLDPPEPRPGHATGQVGALPRQIWPPKSTLSSTRATRRPPSAARTVAASRGPSANDDHVIGLRGGR